MQPTLDPIDLAGREPIERIRGRNATKADVLFYRLVERAVAVKTYAPRPWWIRHGLGRWLIRREAAAYEAAAGVAGLPAFLGRLGPFALATEHLDARPLASLRRTGHERLDDGVFDAVAAILDDLHHRGIAVADLHHRDVLLAADGSVFLVDLAMAWILGQRPGRLRKAVFCRLCDQDRVALARMRARFTGRDVAAAVAAVSPSAAAWHARGRRLKSLIDHLRGKSRRAETSDRDTSDRETSDHETSDRGHEPTQ